MKCVSEEIISFIIGHDIHLCVHNKHEKKGKYVGVLGSKG